MANNWKCETHSANADPEIITENWVPVEREIIFENWVAADWWNRQRPLIHDWRMKSIEKQSHHWRMELPVNRVAPNQKSWAKT